ncbi:hypothetical protein GE21DRAFT_6943 [Neurospora crassa]|uniref:Uncharacterized protein n=2 Tax=Neurospora crassa TaxID=5141 RepID=Q1K669_NEUCR|nr:hypothetical protein NCU08921 [Neurospora crassa OR74A]EAA29454.1 hypothetical protein NCU08921 [Neurospora crassa OR74A]KHE83878.1 hypothetical protein GE21DRAFT_6943 [Neurospora crassa]CAD70744.1 hypothetical protein [Neurospora crassa]|eukprot:XP_958690.1 hypothetical protein NCU08921 [Neurospora crassa OR74A]
MAFGNDKTHDQSPNTSGPVSFTSTYSPSGSFVNPSGSFINPAVPLSLRGGGPGEPASGETEETTHLSPRKDSLDSLPSTTIVESPPLPPLLQRSPMPKTNKECLETLRHESERMIVGSFILSGLIFPGVGNKLADKLAALSGTKLRDMSAIRNESCPPSACAAVALACAEDLLNGICGRYVPGPTPFSVSFPLLYTPSRTGQDGKIGVFQFIDFITPNFKQQLHGFRQVIDDEGASPPTSTNNEHVSMKSSNRLLWSLVADLEHLIYGDEMTKQKDTHRSTKVAKTEGDDTLNHDGPAFSIEKCILQLFYDIDPKEYHSWRTHIEGLPEHAAIRGTDNEAVSNMIASTPKNGETLTTDQVLQLLDHRKTGPLKSEGFVVWRGKSDGLPTDEHQFIWMECKRRPQSHEKQAKTQMKAVRKRVDAYLSSVHDDPAKSANELPLSDMLQTLEAQLAESSSGNESGKSLATKTSANDEITPETELEKGLREELIKRCILRLNPASASTFRSQDKGKKKDDAPYTVTEKPTPKPYRTIGDAVPAVLEELGKEGAPIELSHHNGSSVVAMSIPIDQLQGFERADRADKARQAQLSKKGDPLTSQEREKLALLKSNLKSIRAAFELQEIENRIEELEKQQKVNQRRQEAERDIAETCASAGPNGGRIAKKMASQASAVRGSEANEDNSKAAKQAMRERSYQMICTVADNTRHNATISWLQEQDPTAPSCSVNAVAGPSRTTSEGPVVEEDASMSTASEMGSDADPAVSSERRIELLAQEMGYKEAFDKGLERLRKEFDLSSVADGFDTLLEVDWCHWTADWRAFLRRMEARAMRFIAAHGGAVVDDAVGDIGADDVGGTSVGPDDSAGSPPVADTDTSHGGPAYPASPSASGSSGNPANSENDASLRGGGLNILEEEVQDFWDDVRRQLKIDDEEIYDSESDSGEEARVRREARDAADDAYLAWLRGDSSTAFTMDTLKLFMRPDKDANDKRPAPPLPMPTTRDNTAALSPASKHVPELMAIRCRNLFPPRKSGSKFEEDPRDLDLNREFEEEAVAAAAAAAAAVQVEQQLLLLAKEPPTPPATTQYHHYSWPTSGRKSQEPGGNKELLSRCEKLAKRAKAWPSRLFLFSVKKEDFDPGRNPYKESTSRLKTLFRRVTGAGEEW